MERADLSEALRVWRSQPPVGGGGEAVTIAEADADKFMRAFADAVAGDGEVFLCDPNWGRNERSQLASLLKTGASPAETPRGRGWLMIPTGGSSGRLKFARHDQATIATAVRGFTAHFQLARVNAIGLLPLHHVSGLMAWLRSAITGGEYRQLDWKSLERGVRPSMPDQPDGWVISLVPTQLDRLLHQREGAEWLRQFRVIFVGGAPSWPELLERAASERLPLSLTYGMTETAAMVTALRPEEFLAGNRSNGKSLPHAQVGLTDEGTVTVAAQSVFRGYYPEWKNDTGHDTGDLGALDATGYLAILGRKDGAIISGGEKVHAAEVEAVLRATGAFNEIAVVGLPDPEWGQIVVAAFPATPAPDLGAVNAALREKLAPYKCPKHYVPLASWPRTAAGKVNRAEVVRLAEIGMRERDVR